MSTTTAHPATEDPMPGQAPRRPAPGPDSAPAAGRTTDGAPDVDAMRAEIDAIDEEIVRLVKRRSAVSHAIGAARAQDGGTRIVYSREMKVLERFADLGPAGTELGMLLLSLGRGKLGRR